MPPDEREQIADAVNISLDICQKVERYIHALDNIPDPYRYQVIGDVEKRLIQPIITELLSLMNKKEVVK